jgi:hypothetical protein
MRALSVVMDRVAKAIGSNQGEESTSRAPRLPTTSMLDELGALWQPMVAVPRTIAIAAEGAQDLTTRGTSAAWCVIDLDARVLSCESRGLWWEPFHVVVGSPSQRQEEQRQQTLSHVEGSSDRIVLESANRARSALWQCEIVRGPHGRGSDRSVYYTNLTFSDTAIEPQRGVISGARLRATLANMP